LNEIRTIPEFAKELAIPLDEIPTIQLTKRFRVELNIQEPAAVDLDKEWGIQNLRKNLTINLRNGRETIVVRILRFLLHSCPDRTATKEEIMLACDFSTFNHYIRWNRENQEYKLLIPYENVWKINPEVENALQDILQRL
jgi:hypothetical protein